LKIANFQKKLWEPKLSFPKKNKFDLSQIKMKDFKNFVRTATGKKYSLPNDLQTSIALF